MKIGIDIRSLMEPRLTGVGEYSLNLLKGIFEIDHENEYFLFYNKRSPCENKALISSFSGGLHKLCGFKHPNKILNVSFNVLGWPEIDKKIGPLDLFFLPNFQFIALSDQCKKVLTAHDLSFERYPEFFSWKRRLWHWAVKPRRLVKEVDRIIAVSENTKQDLIELYGVKPEKISVVYSGVESGAQNVEPKIIKNKYNLPENFILYLGTLEPRKNVVGLIRAFETLDIPCHLVIAGHSGWLYRDIYKTAQTSPVADRINFIGYVDPRDKPVLYSLAKIFVYPSFYEGFGFPPLEAMACGAPVIVSANSSLPEVAGDAALFVDPYNINEMAGAIKQIATDDRLREKLIIEGKKQAQKFKWRECARKTLDIWRNTVC